MDNLKLAWRNLWRNKRRTLITVGSVFFAIFFALIMRSMQLGSYDRMFKNVIESYTGYIQVQHPKFWDDKTIDNLLQYNENLDEIISADPNVIASVPRLESFALASNGPQSKGVLVMGIDPEKENLMSQVEDKLVRYRLTKDIVENLKNEDVLPDEIKDQLDLFKNSAYAGTGRLQVDFGISDDDFPGILPIFEKHASFQSAYLELGKQDALVGDKLARYLDLEVGDTIILLGQGYHGTTAAGKYAIAGLVKMPSPDIDSRILFLPVDVAQELFGAENMLTSLSLHLDKKSDKHIEKTMARLEKVIPEEVVVRDWIDMNELMIQQMDADDKQGMIMIFILYMVIAFGIFGTVLMMTAERSREFGVLVAIGMQKAKLAKIVSIEMVLIGFLGILSGMVAAAPVVIYGYYNPIRFSGEMAKMYEDMGFEPVMAFAWFENYYFLQGLVVFSIVVLAIFYPVIKIFTLKVITALRA